MGWSDGSRVAAISRGVTVAIDAAAAGQGSWDQVPAVLSKAFPGSFGGLYNMNFPDNRLNFLSWQNVDPTFEKTFAEHFAYINPWAPYWASLKSTTIAASENVFPARTFARSEFYNDWLMPQDKAVAAVGMKVVGERNEAVYLLLHFPLSKSEAYDRAGLGVMAQIRGSIERSVNLTRLLRADMETALARASLVARSRCAAFVVSGDRRLCDANAQAEWLLSSGQCITIRQGQCHLADTTADTHFGVALGRLSNGLPTSASRIACRTAGGAWQVSIATIPLPEFANQGGLALLPPQQMVLVLVEELGFKRTDDHDLASLAAVFGLTPSEIAFCRRLLFGESVTDAAEQLGISVETARSRLKSIFQKTGASRQGQLMLLLARLH